MLKQIVKLFHLDVCNLGRNQFYRNITESAQKDSHVSSLLEGIIRQDRAALAEAITLVESTNPTKQKKAQDLLTRILEHQKQKVAQNGEKALSFRIGVSGPPGAGKSTFLEAIGTQLTGQGHKVGCLTVDPSSRITGGSLLGDKTRMPNLSRDPKAFIRPSPNSGVLGGVTRTTSEAILLFEAAGFDVIFVETVGSGQNEYVVSDMTDMFVVVISPGAGDELQALKRGIMELSHLVIVNKADGDLLAAARRTQAEYISALKFMAPQNSFWQPKVVRLSSVTGEGISACWEILLKFKETSLSSGYFLQRRSAQNTLQMWSFVEEHLQSSFKSNKAVLAKREEIEKSVSEGIITPIAGALLLLDVYLEQKNQR